MRSSPSVSRSLLLHVGFVVLSTLVLLSPGSAMAGKNADGALIVHTNDAVNYTFFNGDYCGVDFDDPGTCENAGRRTDKDENTAAVIWFLAAFPDGSNPGVSVIYFGVDHNITPTQGYIGPWGLCGPTGTLEIPDTGWPSDTNAGNSVAFGEPIVGDVLFPLYWSAVYGFDGAYFGTGINPTGGYAAFVDYSNPGVQDEITRFGSVRWHAAGSNDCPGSGEGDDGGPGDGEDWGDDEWLDGDGERRWIRDCILARLREDLPMPPRDPVDGLGIPAFDELSRELGVVSVQRVLRLGDEACSRYPVGSRLVSIRFETGTDEVGAVQQFQQLPEIVWAGPNYVFTGEVFSPQVDEPQEADGAFDQQWHLKWLAGAKSCLNPEWDLQCCDECDIGLDVAWQYTRGDPDVIVAFIDAGADMQHPDLFDAYMVNPHQGTDPRNWEDRNGDGVANLCAYDPENPEGDLDGLDNDGNGVVDDVLYGWKIVHDPNEPERWRPGWEHRPIDSDHGTLVAGILGAITNNGLGVASVAGGDADPLDPRPGVRLIQFSYSFFQLILGGVINSFYYAHDNGAHVYSSSSATMMDDAPVPAIVDELGASMLFVQAVGNGGGTPMSSEFAKVPGVMAIGGYDCRHGGRWIIPGGSGGWAGSDYGPQLSVMGPADDQVEDASYERMVMASTSLATDWPPYVCEPPESPDPIDCFGGTSAAAPVVASVAALVFSYADERGTDLSAHQVRKIIERTAEDIQCDPDEPGCDCSDPDPSCSVRLLGWDEYTGYGRVDAGRALTLPVAALEMEPYEDFVIWEGRVHLTWEMLDVDPLNGGTPDHLELHYLIPEDPQGWQELDADIALNDPPFFDWIVPDGFPLGDNRYFRLNVVDPGQQVLNQDYRRFSVYETTDIGDPGGSPPAFSALSIAPNPAWDGARIRYVLRLPGHLGVRVFDVAGRHIKTLTQGDKPAGSSVLDWDGRDESGHHVASGIYFIRADLGAQAKTERLLFIR